MSETPASPPVNSRFFISSTGRKTHFEKVFAYAKSRTATALVTCLVVLLPLAALASPAKIPEKANLIIVGDRVADIAYNLGVVPAAMSVRCAMWPMCSSLKTSSQVLGCPNCLLKKKGAPLLKFAKENNITRVIIETGNPFCTYVPELAPETLVPLLRDKGMTVDLVPCTKDLAAFVKNVADLLGTTAKVEKLMKNYDKKLKQVMEEISRTKFVDKVVIINGVFQAGTGNTFLRIEAPGGYADQYLLAPLGTKNKGAGMVPNGKKPAKGHITIRKLDTLSRANPDAIIITGDAFAVQQALSRAILKNPDLNKVAAIKNHRIFSLPGFINSSLIEYPGILLQWAHVLEQ